MKKRPKMDDLIAASRVPKDKFEEFSLFFPYVVKETYRLFRSGGRFVHYTTAENAARIISGRSVWMRKTTVMNDFLEFEHGMRCLKSALSSPLGERMAAAFEPYGPNLASEAVERFFGWEHHLRHDTYIACISEHLPSEDYFGRLSMWRAYGGVAGVAIVLNGAPFFSWQDGLGVNTSPVAYMSETAFQAMFVDFLAGIEEGQQVLSSMDRERIIGYVFGGLRYAALCTKHPGFVEEQEWRLIHSPILDPNEVLEPSIETVGGTPQRIFKIPLEKMGSIIGTDPGAMIDRVIIGPAEHPREIWQAMVELLGTKLGIADPEKKVFISTIPLRQH